jgi:hypothetical protein
MQPASSSCYSRRFAKQSAAAIREEIAARWRNSDQERLSFTAHKMERMIGREGKPFYHFHRPWLTLSRKLELHTREPGALQADDASAKQSKNKRYRSDVLNDVHLKSIHELPHEYGSTGFGTLNIAQSNQFASSAKLHGLIDGDSHGQRHAWTELQQVAQR